MAVIEFRDGIREVPEHLASLMVGLPTYKMTFDQATIEANNRLVKDEINRRHADIIRNHFRTGALKG